MQIRIKELIGNVCVTREDGDRVYSFIYDLISSKNKISVDFSGVDIFASPFFNSAFGRLYKEFSKDDVNSYLVCTSLNSNGKKVMDLVVENSIRYYKDVNFKNALDKVLAETEGEEEI